MAQHMKKERIDFRTTLEQKHSIELAAQKRGISASEYLRTLVEANLQTISHEQQIESAILENRLINTLLTHPKLSNKDKQIICEEVKKSCLILD